MTKIIEAENLTKIYKGKVKAVDHISFSVEEGEVFGFLGPNGAGKTTTIKMLNTLAMITEGRAMVAGHDVAKNPGAVRRASAWCRRNSPQTMSSKGARISSWQQ